MYRTRVVPGLRLLRLRFTVTLVPRVTRTPDYGFVYRRLRSLLHVFIVPVTRVYVTFVRYVYVTVCVGYVAVRLFARLRLFDCVTFWTLRRV